MSSTMSGTITAAEAAPVLRRDMVRVRLRRTVAAAAVAAMLSAAGSWYGYDWWTQGRFIQTTDDAYVGGNVTPVAPHVSGFVEQVLVTDNQLVKAGQVLIRIDARDYQAALAHAQAVLSARSAALDGLRAQYVLQQSTIRQMQAELTAKTAQASFATIDAARYRTLAQTAAGSRQDAQRTSTLETQAQAAVLAADAGLEAARQQLQVLRAQIAEADAATAQAQADLATARLNLGYTEIRSPIDGFVGNRAAQVGAFVSAGTYLISVVPSAGLWVDANFKEDQLGRMITGQPATVTADMLPDHPFQGHVASLAPGTGAVFSVIPPENATGNFTKIVQRVPVRILLNAGDPKLPILRPGLSITASVDTKGDVPKGDVPGSDVPRSDVPRSDVPKGHLP